MVMSRRIFKSQSGQKFSWTVVTKELLLDEIFIQNVILQKNYVTQLASDTFFQSQTLILTTDEILYNLDKDKPFLLSTTDGTNHVEDLFLVKMKHKKNLVYRTYPRGRLGTLSVKIT